MIGRLWTDEETTILREMMGAARDVSEIMARLGRSKHSIKERWRWINRTEEDRVRRQKQINLNRHMRNNCIAGVGASRLVSYREIPEEVTIIRAARLNAGPQSLTGAFFGDPPRGFSALDRKMSGQADEPYIDHRLAQLQRMPSLARVLA